MTGLGVDSVVSCSYYYYISPAVSSRTCSKAKSESFSSPSPPPLFSYSTILIYIINF